jgi:dsRNA-specific ribonuclease
MDITAEFIKTTFNKSNINPKYLSILTDIKALNIYAAAFTSNTVDPINNYELLEYLGDVAANNAIVLYFYNTFPQLRNHESIKIFTRLKIVHTSRDSFSKIAYDLGFLPYIKYDDSITETRLKKTQDALLEDVFEAFIGATECILGDAFDIVGVGVASQIIYNFIKSIFDNKVISFDLDDLYDAKTRLKELFEVRKDTVNLLLQKYGTPKYMDSPVGTGVTLKFINISFSDDAGSKQKSQKNVAQKAIDYFARLGYTTDKKINLFTATKR